MKAVDTTARPAAPRTAEVAAALVGALLGAPAGLLAIGGPVWLILGGDRVIDNWLLPLSVAGAGAAAGALACAWSAVQLLRHLRGEGIVGAPQERSYRRLVVRPMLALFAIAPLPWLAVVLIFPVRTPWGDGVLIDLGPQHARYRYEVDLGDVAITDGGDYAWTLPGTKAQGFTLELAPLLEALPKARATAELTVNDGGAPRSVHLDGAPGVADPASQDALTRTARERLAAVSVLPPSPRPIRIRLRLEAPAARTQPAVHVPMRAHETWRK